MHSEKVSVAVVDRLVPTVTEVTPLNEQIFRLSMSLTLCYFSGLYVSFDWDERILLEKVFYAQL